MKLINVKVENFRCYQIPFSIKVDDFTAIVGRNDIGKSALLEALSIYFGQSKMDKFDASVDGDPANVRITCVFSDLPHQLIIDADNPTTLQNEYLLNQDDNLEITKVYNASTDTVKNTNIHANAFHPSSEGYADLLSVKHTDLVKRASKLKIDLEGVNKTKSAEIRTAIWGACPELQLSNSIVDLQKETGKQAWVALSKYLPTYWLFKADRASTDQDDEAQDPLNAAIAEAVKAIAGDLEKITKRVKMEVTKVAKLTLQKIAEMDPELSATLDPIVKTKKWESLFQTSITGDNGIPLNKRGSGVRRLILLNFFRAQIEAQVADEENASVIYAIEEPETSQHPRNQRLLFSTLQRLTADPSRQVLVTTHTPMFARIVPEHQLRFIYNKGRHRALACGGSASNSKIAKSLGVSADNNVKLFIGVEGPNDITFLTEVSKILAKSDANFVNLEKLVNDGEIIFIPLGGSCLAIWADRLQSLNRPELHICDRDNPPGQLPRYADHVNIINARDGCVAFNTNRREMENYVHPDAIIEAYQASGTVIELPEIFLEFDDVPEIVAKALYTASSDKEWDDLAGEKQKKKMSQAKKTINNSATQNMTVDLLKKLGGFDEILDWFSNIKRIIEIDN